MAARFRWVAYYGLDPDWWCHFGSSMARVMPEPVEVGSCLKYDVASAPLAPHRGDVSAAEADLWPCSRRLCHRQLEASRWKGSIAQGGFSLEAWGLFQSIPHGRLTLSLKTAEMIVNDMFFPAVKLSPIPLERLLDPNDDKDHGSEHISGLLLSCFTQGEIPSRFEEHWVGDWSRADENTWIFTPSGNCGQYRADR